MKTSSKSSNKKSKHDTDSCIKSLSKKRVFINTSGVSKDYKYTSVFKSRDGKIVKTTAKQTVLPYEICVHNAMDLGNGSLGKLDYLQLKGFTISGWSNYRMFNSN